MRSLSHWRISARAAVVSSSLVGVVLFGTCWVLITANPKRVEAAAFTFIKAKIVEEAHLHLQSNAPPSLRRSIEVAQARFEKLAAKHDKRAANGVPELVALVTAEICACGPLPEARLQLAADIADGLRDAWRSEARRLRYAAKGLTDFVSGRYRQRRDRLLVELGTFTGSNAAIFLTVLVIGVLSPARSRMLAVPTALLAVATVASACLYLFQQNWFFSIAFEDYVGHAYWVYVGLLFGFLVDIVLNRGRITNALLSVVGGVVPAPC